MSKPIYLNDEDRAILEHALDQFRDTLEGSGASAEDLGFDDDEHLCLTLTSLCQRIADSIDEDSENDR